MTLKIQITFLCIFFSLIGCASPRDRSLAPPPDSETINITVKVPKELGVETLEVMYRSTTCKRITHGASGQRVEIDGRHGIDMQLQRQGNTDLFTADVPKDGGGACKWHLANVTFGLAYKNPSQFGESVIFGGGGGVVVIFDHNRSPQGGADFQVDGDVVIKKEYFPWLHERYLGGYRKRISLAGAGHIYLMYRALNARKVYFEPVLHSDFLVTSQGTKVHKIGDFIKFTYPDGSVVAESQARPDYYKLQTIRTGRVSYCFSPRYYSRCPDRRPQLLPELLPDKEMPGYGRYVVADEWGNAVVSFAYRLFGKNGEKFEGKSGINGLTRPIPDSAHPLSKVEFPERLW
ncbi:hypothetical protein [Pseudomonas mandelii]|uniref:hypothetical protein n=1 Tax=Pseudomonas mandelii TaxID=75612 RepID=UPI00224A6599|nr:hypothetical protein [Pseudomonas mandelii]MCX2900423.1 hypothetical protein [Pseudomonas mandelii]